MPLVSGVLEILDDFLFDTLHTRAPRHDLFDREKMFDVPLGAMTQTNEGPRPKEYLETNMCESRVLPVPHQFVIRAIRCAFVGKTILPVSSRYYADTLLQLMIGCKPYWSGPAWKCADPVTMVLDAATLASIGHKRLDLIRALRRRLDPAPVIRQQEPFFVEVTFAGRSWRDENPVDVPDRLVVLLEGQLARAFV